MTHHHDEAEEKNPPIINLNEIWGDTQKFDDSIIDFVESSPHCPYTCVRPMFYCLKKFCEKTGMDRRDFARVCQSMVNLYDEPEIEGILDVDK
jgi:hypothetical protein